MPKNNRIEDTLRFLREANVSPEGELLKMPVADWLDENKNMIPPATNDAMSQGTTGNERTRKYRRAMILILCGMNNTPPAQAQKAVAGITDANLPNNLGTMLADVQRLAVPRLLNPALQDLLASPQTFLANNRIKLGRGNITTSGPLQCDFFRDCPAKQYILEPPVAFHHNLKVQTPAYNIHVQNFHDIQNNLGAIAGAVVGGTLAATTQLSGCSVIYSVQGGNLVAAHVQPDSSVTANLPADLEPHAGLRLGVLMAMRLARDGDLANAVAGGTLGIFGMVNTGAETDLRQVGARNVRMYVCNDSLGNAYSIGLSGTGNWQLFGQQNNPGQPNAGVNRLHSIFP